MSVQLEAAWTMHEFLTARSVDYAIIGGIAVQRWGEPRFTADLDITVVVPPVLEHEVIAGLLAAFAGRGPDAAGFARKNRVLLLRLPGPCDVDVSFGVPGYEEILARRTVKYDIGDGRRVRICSPEDLIIHKAVAGRPRDCADIEGVIARQGKRLDLRYIRKWLRNFANALDMPEIKARFEVPWRAFLRCMRKT